MDFYYSATLSTCRVAQWKMEAAKAVGVQLNKKIINLLAGEQLKPEYLKINPQHTVPTLVDGDFVLYESRAIMVYLCEQYDTSKKWYPDCPKQRAVINQRLYFDMGTFYKCFRDYYYPQLGFNAPADPEMYKKVEIAFEFFNTFLEGHKFATGDNVTIADISLLASITNFEATTFDIGKYPNVARWYEECKKVVPGYKENLEDWLSFKKYVK
ncbi:hypothetical protein DOY81_012243 [Sarcophaga bullata]|nr:hypothetical protein DOY81_012243 [Sarcophaga bullata]